MAVPASLLPGGVGDAERAAARNYYGTHSNRTKAYAFRAYKEADVKAALRTLFHGKCAYCESYFEATQPADIEHFRPKGGVEESPTHTGYWWLAANWENLLPSCIDCNRRRSQSIVSAGMTMLEAQYAFANAVSVVVGKENSFPTKNDFWCVAEEDPSASEQPLLIDPTAIDPSGHITWELQHDLPVAMPRGSSSEGRVSIKVFALNRFGLVQARHRCLLSLRVITELIKELCDTLDGLDEPARTRQLAKIGEYVDRLLSLTTEETPFSAMARAFVDAFRDELRRELDRYGGG